MTRAPVALSIAGSDPSGGAGIQADLKTFSALGAYGTSVITALTAQNTVGVSGVHVVPTEFVTQQLETLVADVRVDAIKIGMLANAGIIGAVGDFLGRHPHEHVVLDPVMVATSGDRLLDDDAIQAMRDLMPLASLITPNLAEAAALLDTRPARTLADMRLHAMALQELGAARVLIKGGHLDAAPRPWTCCSTSTARRCCGRQSRHGEHPWHRLHAVLSPGGPAPPTRLLARGSLRRQELAHCGAGRGGRARDRPRPRTRSPLPSTEASHVL